MSALARPRPRLAAPLRFARPEDVPDIHALIGGFASRGRMLPRSTADLYRTFREFRVVTRPVGGVVACGALRVYSAELGEVVGLAVDEGSQGRGLGAAVVEALVDDALGYGLSRLFAMTLEEGFFARLGFRPVPRTWIPEKVAADCRGCALRARCRETAVMRLLERG